MPSLKMDSPKVGQLNDWLIMDELKQVKLPLRMFLKTMVEK